MSPGRHDVKPRKTRFRTLAATLAVPVSLFRAIPFLFSFRPRTPLRILCIVAFDTFQATHASGWMHRSRLKLLAAVLDFGACLNIYFDTNKLDRTEYRSTRRVLGNASPQVPVRNYVQRLRELERRRPVPGGDDVTFRDVRRYREEVVALSLGLVAATACGNNGVDEVRPIGKSRDGDLQLLFRIVMLCQIIDDAFDYSQDTSNSLPTFLTAHQSLDQSLKLTRTTALEYASSLKHSSQDLARICRH